MASDGVANSRIATTLGIGRPTVLNWRGRLLADGLDSVGEVRPGRDRHRARGFEAQQREAMVGCTVLNKMLALGKAQSSAVTV